MIVPTAIIMFDTRLILFDVYYSRQLHELHFEAIIRHLLCTRRRRATRPLPIFIQRAMRNDTKRQCKKRLIIARPQDVILK